MTREEIDKWLDQMDPVQLFVEVDKEKRSEYGDKPGKTKWLKLTIRGRFNEPNR